MVLVLVPVTGSFITEPAAMTLVALILGNRFFSAICQRHSNTPPWGCSLFNVSGR